MARWVPENTMTAMVNQTRGRVNPLPGAAARFAVGPALARLVSAIVGAGGRPLAVGGAVRDHLLGKAPKDIDVEVYGVPLETLEQAFARERFEVHAVGRSFGVLKVAVPTDPPRQQAGAPQEPARETFDVALPRRESKEGRGHKGFVVASDPHMDPKDAAARRDFTLNAIAVDLSPENAGALVDPWHGADDLARGVLRHVSPAFDEDPLRVLRAAQFAARLVLDVDESTLERCRTLRGELRTLPAERVWGELEKLCVKGVYPSLGLEVLRKTGALEELFPELHALIGCGQEFEWHPEGDVWRHTLLVTDEAALLSARNGLADDERLRVVLGALCHDLGKPPTTEFIDGRIRSRDHESAGDAPTRAFLGRLGAPLALVEDVVALVRDHLKPFHLWRERDKISDGALRRLALRVPIPRLVHVAQADHFGRTTPDALAREDHASPWLLAQAARLAVDAAKPEPLMLGRHLIQLGLKPGPHFKQLLADAFEAQLDGKFSDEQAGLEWLRTRVPA
jgi:tRNA nucleotidyltransferase (CCA-adding enzyme)